MLLEAVGGVGAAILTVMLAIALHDLILRPGFRRLAFRNIARRRTEAVLVVLGSSLGTAIIAASFLVGATFNASVRDGARTTLGPIDVTVNVPDLARMPKVLNTLVRPPLPHTDGILSTVTGTVAVTSGAGTDAHAEPTATVTEVDFGAARRFGGRVADTGMGSAGATPARGVVVAGSALASSLRIAAGDFLTIHAYGASRVLRVRQVLPKIGLAGAGDVFVAPGTIESMQRDGAASTARAPAGQILVSNDGGVFDSAGPSDEVASIIRARTGAFHGVDVETIKADLLADAHAQGQSMGQLYTGVGVFSVLAGVLLLVNLFVMLAEERKRELGLARATGLKRWHLIRIFTLEGALYALAAALVGAFLGTAVGWLIAQATGRLFHKTDSTFTLRFVAPTVDLVIAALIGLGLAMATVWITSYRVARLNIIRALRDLPEVSHRKHRLQSSGPATVLVMAGVALGLFGVIAASPLAAVIGPPLALVASIPLLRPIVGRRWSTGIASVGTLLWCVGAFTFLTRITSRSGVPVFVVQGVIMVAAAVGLATALDRVWIAIVAGVTRTGRGLAARLGMAYPLDRLFRTSMLIAMYALIVFTLTFLAVYGKIFGGQASTFTRQVSAGTDLRVDANPSNPVDASQLAAVPGVSSVATLLRSGPDFITSYQPVPTQWPLTGFSRSLLDHGVPTLSSRAARFTSDTSAFTAMLHDPSLVVVSSQFLTVAGPKTPGGDHVAVGSHITAMNPVTGLRHPLTVIGIMAHDVVGVGAFASSASVRSLMGTAAVPSRFYVSVAANVDPAAVARQLQVTFPRFGVDAKTFRSLVDTQLDVELGFFKLMQSYMAIGLIVGIAGLAVVMVRAARERRQQVGMLRTIGFSADTVRGAFLTEASFIALQGIATGVGLGLLVSYQMLSHSAALGGDPLPFAVPWVTIAVLAIIPFVASLAVAMIPAMQAASINPAEVLRLSD